MASVADHLAALAAFHSKSNTSVRPFGLVLDNARVGPWVDRLWENSMSTKAVKISFTREVLGTWSGDPDVMRKYIASLSNDAKKIDEEVASLPTEENLEKAVTVFPRLPDGRCGCMDYQWRGYIKGSMGAIKPIRGTECSKVKSHKKYVDLYVHVQPRIIALVLPFTAGELEAINAKLAASPSFEASQAIWAPYEERAKQLCVRPLRAETAQGPRVALAASETRPEGTTCEFQVNCLIEDIWPAIYEAFSFGCWVGFGQWRGGGKGQFSAWIDGKEVAPFEVGERRLAKPLKDEEEKAADEAEKEAAKAEKAAAKKAKKEEAAVA